MKDVADTLEVKIALTVTTLGLMGQREITDVSAVTCISAVGRACCVTWGIACAQRDSASLTGKGFMCVHISGPG